MTNKERMLHMVLDDTKLQELYDYDQSEYEDLYTALNSDIISLRKRWISLTLRTRLKWLAGVIHIAQMLCVGWN